jgi:hypothetical protein
VRLAIGSSVVSACSSIRYALNCFAVSLFCLFCFVYLLEMKILMFGHVLLATGFAPYSLTAVSYSPDAFR